MTVALAGSGMKRKVLKGSNGKRRKSSKMKGTLAKHLQVQLGRVSVLPFQFQQSSSSTTAVSNSSSLFQNLLDSEASDPQLHYLKENPSIGNIDIDEKDFILSQDLFWFVFLHFIPDLKFLCFYPVF